MQLGEGRMAMDAVTVRFLLCSAFDEFMRPRQLSSLALFG